MLTGVPAGMVKGPLGTWRASVGDTRDNRVMTPWLRREPSFITAPKYGRLFSSLKGGRVDGLGMTVASSVWRRDRIAGLARMW